MTPVEVTRCIRSFALLKWLSLPLFEAISQVRRQRACVAPAGPNMNVMNFPLSCDAPLQSAIRIHAALGSALAPSEPLLHSAAHPREFSSSAPVLMPVPSKWGYHTALLPLPAFPFSAREALKDPFLVVPISPWVWASFWMMYSTFCCQYSFLNLWFCSLSIPVCPG